MQQASDDICLLAFRHNYKRPSTKHETNRSTPKKPTHHSPVQPEIFCQSKGCLLFTSPPRAEIDGTVVSLHIWCHSRLTPTQFPALDHILNSVSGTWDPVESPVETVDERPLRLEAEIEKEKSKTSKMCFCPVRLAAWLARDIISRSLHSDNSPADNLDNWDNLMIIRSRPPQHGAGLPGPKAPQAFTGSECVRKPSMLCHF